MHDTGLVDAHHNRSFVLVRLGRVDEAIAASALANGRRPDFALGWRQHGRALLARGHLEAARGSLARALALGHVTADIYEALGEAAMRRGDVPGALAACDAALTLWPDLAPLHHNRGYALARLGRVADARAAFKAALARDPACAAAAQAGAAAGAAPRFQGIVACLSQEGRCGAQRLRISTRCGAGAPRRPRGALDAPPDPRLHPEPSRPMRPRRRGSAPARLKHRGGRHAPKAPRRSPGGCPPMDLSAAQVHQLLVLIVALPLGSSLLLGLAGARLPRRLVGWTACASVMGAGAAAVALFAALAADPARTPLTADLFTWIAAGPLRLDASLVFDPLSGIMALCVLGVGTLVHVYSLGYMADDPGWARYFALLGGFTAAMLLLLLADSLPLMFVGWEGVGLCSYLLVGFWFEDLAKATAGSKAFFVNRIGDAGLFAAMLLLYRGAGTLSFGPLAEAAGAGRLGTGLATAAAFGLLLAITGKSAQLPLWVWLPDAMAGPTPVSALIHAATMVTAGVYLAARMKFLFWLAPTALLAMALVGAMTALMAATAGCAQNDIKRVLAYSTVSQLGYMVLGAGVGAPATALFHVLTHAAFKGCLFLAAGSVIHGLGGEQDMRRMGGLARKMPVTCASFVAATLCIGGLPPLSGFISKDAILAQVAAAGEGPLAATFAPVVPWLMAMALLTAGLTAFYMGRAACLTFFSGAPRGPAAAGHAHEAPWTMALPQALLAAMALGAGALGWPEVLGGGDWLAGWLTPVLGAAPVAEAPGAAARLMATSGAIAVAGLGVAGVLYGRGPVPHPWLTAASGKSGAWLRARLLGAWHLDGLYAITVVRPWRAVARVGLAGGVERGLVEGSAQGLARLAQSLGFFGQLFQNGNIQRYLAIFAVGLAAILAGWLTPPGARALGALGALGMGHRPAAVAPHVEAGR